MTSLSLERCSLLLDGWLLHTNVLLSPSECDCAVRGFWFRVSNVHFLCEKSWRGKKKQRERWHERRFVCQSLHAAAGKSCFWGLNLIFSRFYKHWLDPHGLMFHSGAKLSSQTLRNMLNRKTAKDLSVSSKSFPQKWNKEVFLLSISATVPSGFLPTIQWLSRTS